MALPSAESSKVNGQIKNKVPSLTFPAGFSRESERRCKIIFPECSVGVIGKSEVILFGPLDWSSYHVV